MARRAFSLIEVLMSVFILGIGVIAIASLLPAGISQQRSARDASAGPIVAQSAMAVLRSKYSQSTFGGDDLPSGWSDSISSCQNGSGLLKDFFCHLPPGDFGWTRPARWSRSYIVWTYREQRIGRRHGSLRPTRCCSSVRWPSCIQCSDRRNRFNLVVQCAAKLFG